MNTDEVVIPAGKASQLHELYVAVNRLFKGYLKQLYNEWLFGEDHALNPAGTIKKLSVALCNWIITAWYDISPEVTEEFAEMLFIQYFGWDCWLCIRHYSEEVGNVSSECEEDEDSGFGHGRLNKRWRWRGWHWLVKVDRMSFFVYWLL